eukprot:COSAG06_NODE_2091_length_7610_cov_2.766343_3_plen_976_part_00
MAGGDDEVDEAARLRALGFVPGNSFRRSVSGSSQRSPPLEGERPASQKRPTVAEATGIFAKLTDPAQYTGLHRHRFDSDGTGKGLAGRDRVTKGTGSYGVDDSLASMLRPELYESPSPPPSPPPRRTPSILRSPGSGSSPMSAVVAPPAAPAAVSVVLRERARWPEPEPEPEQQPVPLSPQRVVWTGRDAPLPLETTPVAMSPQAGASPGQMVAERRKHHQLLSRACTHVRTYRMGLGFRAWVDWFDALLLARERAGHALAWLMNRQLATAWQGWADMYSEATQRRKSLLEQCTHKLMNALVARALEDWHVAVAERLAWRTQLSGAAVRALQQTQTRAALNSWSSHARKDAAVRRKVAACALRILYRHVSRAFNAWWAVKLESDEKRRQSMLNLERSKQIQEIVERFRLSLAWRQQRGAFDLWLAVLRTMQKVRLALARLRNVAAGRAWSAWAAWFAQRMIKKSKLRLCIRVLQHQVTGKALRRWRAWASTRKSHHAILTWIVARMRAKSLGAAWTQWTVHVEQLKDQTQKLGIAVQCLRSALLGKALRGWRHNANEAVRLRGVAHRVVRGMTNRSLTRALQGWRRFCNEAVRLRCLCQGIILRISELQLSAAWATWAQSCRGAGARREAVVLRVCAAVANGLLSRALGRWKDYTDETVRMRAIALKALGALRARVLRAAWLQWDAMVDELCRNQELTERAVRHMRSQALSVSFLRWDQNAMTVIRQRELLSQAVVWMKQRLLSQALLRWREVLDNVDGPTEGGRVGSGGPDLTRLMIYSSDTPDIEDFASMIRCQKARYDFETATAETLKQIVVNAVAANDFKRLKSIAIACHGPPPDADGEPNAGFRRRLGVVGSGKEEQFCWPITRTVVVRDDTELKNTGHSARQVVDALGSAVKNGSGRVDLLACSLLKSKEGREVFHTIEQETRCNFAASDNLTGNPRDGGDWVRTFLPAKKMRHAVLGLIPCLVLRRLS